MKKSLLALAAVGATATGAWAQSSVTLFGVVDLNVSYIKNDEASYSLGQDGMASSRLGFRGPEDLGGGMKAEFKGVALISTVSGQTGNAALPFSQNQNVLNDEIWVGASGGFGSIKLGAPNSAMLETNGKIQPFGTAMSGGYQNVGINRLGATTTTVGVNQFVGGASANGRVVRHERTMRYDTPVFNGFSASIAYAAKNDKSATATSNSNGYTDIGLNYSNGPLNLAYANTKIEAGNTAAAGNLSAVAAATVASAFTQAAVLTANQSVKYQMFGGNYTLGAATLYGGYTTAKGSGGNTMDVTSWNVAAKYALNAAVDVMANYVKVDDKATANAAKDQKLTGLGVDYKLSKRTAAYLRYEDYKTNTSDATTGVKNTAIGLRHTF